jgi:hypothetical protein
LPIKKERKKKYILYMLRFRTLSVVDGFYALLCEYWASQKVQEPTEVASTKDTKHGGMAGSRTVSVAL